MQKILVLRGGALGDLLVTLPALAALRSRWPEARIELVGNATAAALAVDAGLIDVVHSQHAARWSTLYGSTPLPPEIAAELATFDLVITFWPDPAQELARRFPVRPGQVFLAGAAWPLTAPAAAHYCAPLAACGVVASSLHYVLPTPALPRRKLAIHPGSGSAKKNWPLDRWLELGRWLVRDRGAELLVITGEADTAAAAALAGLGVAIHGRPLREVVNHLAECRLFVGHDSGISHLAAACQVPSVLLFGPTDPTMWAPPAPLVRVLQRGALVANLSVEEVQAAIDAALLPPPAS